MITSASSQTPQRLYRIDKFNVPQSARGEFLEKVRTTHQFLRTLPGFVRDALFEAAKKAVMAKHEEEEFHPREMFARLGIDADLANYRQVEA